MRYFLVSLLIVTGLELRAQKLNSLLWEVESPEGKISYVFGTYHLVGSEYLKEHKKVAEAFQKSELVVVETVIDSSKLFEVAFMGMMPQNSLRQLVDSADYVALKDQFEEVTGMNIQTLDKMKPIALASMYSMALAEENTPEDLHFSGTPIDIHFAAKGAELGKNLRALESMTEQAELLFSSISLEEQAEMLVELVTGTEEASQLSGSILEAYENQDLDKMWQISEEMGDAYGSMNLLLDDRNHKWMEMLKPWLNEGGAFVAVGALHLPGKNGLLQLLQDEGFNLRPL